MILMVYTGCQLALRIDVYALLPAHPVYLLYISSPATRCYLPQMHAGNLHKHTPIPSANLSTSSRSTWMHTYSRCIISVLVGSFSCDHQLKNQGGVTYRSMHFPAVRFPTQSPLKPFCSNTSVYHGLSAAVLNNTLPPTFSTRLRAITCSSASLPSGLNQSILSISTAMVSVPGEIRHITSINASV